MFVKHMVRWIQVWILSTIPWVLRLEPLCMRPAFGFLRRSTCSPFGSANNAMEDDVPADAGGDDVHGLEVLPQLRYPLREALLSLNDSVGTPGTRDSRLGILGSSPRD